MIGSRLQNLLNQNRFPATLAESYGSIWIARPRDSLGGTGSWKSVIECLDELRAVNKVSFFLLIAAAFTGWILPYTALFVISATLAFVFFGASEERRHVKEFERLLDEVEVALDRWRSCRELELSELRSHAENVLVGAAMRVLVAERDNANPEAIDELRAKCKKIHQLFLHYKLVGDDYTPHYRAAKQKMGEVSQSTAP